jgi:MFS family permease
MGEPGMQRHAVADCETAAPTAVSDPVTMPPRPRLDAATLHALPRSIWALGFVSLLMDVSSEMIHSLLPVYLVTTLGVSVVAVGVLEGAAEATAAVTRVFSGALADWAGRRKPLALAGYALAALTKPVFPMATGIGWVAAARVLDRIGKGIRGAPRDALVADLAPARLRGTAFGLRQALDTTGAVVGPLLALLLVPAFGGALRPVFWIAVLPAWLAVGILVTGVREPAADGERRPPRFPLRRRELIRLGQPFWRMTAATGVLMLARTSEAFLLLRGQSVGVPLAWVPGVLLAMNLVYAAAAYPAGVLADRHGHFPLLATGITLLVAAHLTLALLPGVSSVALGAILWGAHLAATQGVLAALVADTCPADLRGTAFGVLGFVSGGALLAGSSVAGLLWAVAGPPGAFLAGAGCAAVALVLFARHRQFPAATRA